MERKKHENFNGFMMMVSYKIFLNDDRILINSIFGEFDFKA